MRVASRFLVLLSVGSLMSCQAPPAGLTQSEKDAAATSAKAVVDALFQKWNQLDFAGSLTFYSADPDARFIENGAAFPSLDAMKQQYAELGPTLERLENTVDSQTAVVLAEDAVAVTTPVHFRIKAKGRPEYAGQYVWSGIIQRRNGTWQVIQSHESWLNAEQVMAAILPAPPAPEHTKK